MLFNDYVRSIVDYEDDNTSPLRCRSSFLKLIAEILVPKKNLHGMLETTILGGISRSM